MFYGKDCPQGMVQVEFVGVDPALRVGYGYRPSADAFIEVYVDGVRYHIAVGTGERRGLQVICDQPVQARVTANGVEVWHHA